MGRLGLVGEHFGFSGTPRMPLITVNVYANLREFTGGEPSVEVDIAPGGTIGDIVRQMGIPPEKTKIIFKNNRPASLDDEVTGEERIDLFSAIGGG